MRIGPFTFDEPEHIQDVLNCIAFTSAERRMADELAAEWDGTLGELIQHIQKQTRPHLYYRSGADNTNKTKGGSPV